MKENKSHASLSEVHSSVHVGAQGGFWKKLLAFMGPAYMVSVGYMDPGNWATDIAGGSRYGYSLIWVLLMSNLMALLLQSLSARLGIVRGRDLAQASRETYPKYINFFLYFLAEIAIAACDLAEVIGMAIGLQLLFDLPLLAGVCISVLDTFLLLFLMNKGIRKMEAFIFTLVGIIGLSFLAEMIFAKPDAGELVKGFIPSLPDESALYIAIGIIGATVMPHNLYLHSSLVQTRKIERIPTEIAKAIRFNLIDSTIALNLAFFVNAAILILAASTFYNHGLFDVAEIQDAHKFLAPLLGNEWAPILFAVALIAAGQSSTVTGTLAGQIVMEGYLNLRIQPWIRRILTRIIAIAPAMITITLFGEEATGELLILSQVILSLQLGFAIVPLIHFVSDKNRMGAFSISAKIQVLAWIAAAIIISLNVNLVIKEITGWLDNTSHPVLLWLTVVPVTIAAGMLLLYITFKPFIKGRSRYKAETPHGEFPELKLANVASYKKIAVTVDFSDMDIKAINEAVRQGGKDAEYLLVHIVETPGAMVLGQDIADMETTADVKHIEDYIRFLISQGYNASYKLGYGKAEKRIPALVEEFNSDLLVMGAHGHRAIMDLILGSTVDGVRHNVKVPVLIVR